MGVDQEGGRSRLCNAKCNGEELIPDLVTPLVFPQDLTALGSWLKTLFLKTFPGSLSSSAI